MSRDDVTERLPHHCISLSATWQESCMRGDECGASGDVGSLFHPNGGC